jgi:molybdenum cofactor guanylyltransferase
VIAKAAPPLVAIFVGGASRRMGGHPKGLLRAPGGGTIVERWRSLATTVGLSSVLVGDAGAYAHLGVEIIRDEIPEAGPLGGLVGVLRSRPEAQVVAAACDMPYVTADLLRRLAFSESDAAVLAPWRQKDERYEPLFARYDRARVLPLAQRQLTGAGGQRQLTGTGGAVGAIGAVGDRSLQKLLRDAGARPFTLSDEEWPLLADWDEPADTLA